VVRVGNSTIQTFFSPRGGGQEAILQTLNQAQKRISFMTFSFTDKDVANLMIQKKQAGLRVDGVYDQCLGYGQYSTYHMMRQAGIHTRMDGNEALLHHKTILADDTVITGSYNFSANADKTNNENMLIIQNSYVSASYYQEYDRVMTAATHNNPPKNKCPWE
jgi:phosphatidylserine/phosphatidylglycerophosphate/cardiolipin synthase-like enzyme